MRDSISRLGSLIARWRGDLLLTILTLAWMLATAAATAGLGRHPLELVVILPVAASLSIRNRWPILAALLAGSALLLAIPFGLTGLVGNWLALSVSWTAFLLCFALGTSASFIASLAGAAFLAISLQAAGGPFSPIIEMITLGAWLAGRVMRSRRALTAQLEARNLELASQQEHFARESVRYERARITRELHDIVAHCLSVMVIQASAGQRVADADRDGMAEALTSVAESAALAQEETGRLVEMLRGDLPEGSSPNLLMIDELVGRAATTGLKVTYRLSGACELAPAASGAAYRVVQEALTNALKHAPGAPVVVTVTAMGAQVGICVQNAARAEQPSALARSGGAYGLTAMRERITACGGSLSAGPTAEGGWQVRALLPTLARRRVGAGEPSSAAASDSRGRG
jgi:signal transduction histidine kinase